MNLKYYAVRTIICSMKRCSECTRSSLSAFKREMKLFHERLFHYDSNDDEHELIVNLACTFHLLVRTNEIAVWGTSKSIQGLEKVPSPTQTDYEQTYEELPLPHWFILMRTKFASLIDARCNLIKLRAS